MQGEVSSCPATLLPCPFARLSLCGHRFLAACCSIASSACLVPLLLPLPSCAPLAAPVLLQEPSQQPAVRPDPLRGWADDRSYNPVSVGWVRRKGTNHLLLLLPKVERVSVYCCIALVVFQPQLLVHLCLLLMVLPSCWSFLCAHPLQALFPSRHALRPNCCLSLPVPSLLRR